MDADARRLIYCGGVGTGAFIDSAGVCRSVSISVRIRLAVDPLARHAANMPTNDELQVLLAPATNEWVIEDSREYAFGSKVFFHVREGVAISMPRASFLQSSPALSSHNRTFARSCRAIFYLLSARRNISVVVRFRSNFTGNCEASGRPFTLCEQHVVAWKTDWPVRPLSLHFYPSSSLVFAGDAIRHASWNSTPMFQCTCNMSRGFTSNQSVH